jgi:hypothetical protein
MASKARCNNEKVTNEANVSISSSTTEAIARVLPRGSAALDSVQLGSRSRDKQRLRMAASEGCTSLDVLVVGL